MKKYSSRTTARLKIKKLRRRLLGRNGLVRLLLWGIPIGIILLLGQLSLVLYLAIFPLVLWIILIATAKEAWRASLIPFSTIRGATQGPVKLKGQLSDESLFSPFTNTPCKAWRVEISFGPKTRRISPKRANTFESDHKYLTLDDGTGLCVLPFNDNWDLEKKFNQQLDTMSEVNALPETGRLLIGKEISKRSGLSFANTRWIVREYRIDNDDTVYAQGIFKSTRGSETPYDQSSLQRIKRKGAAASRFSRWAIKEVGDGLEADENFKRDDWRRHAHKTLGPSGVSGKSTLPNDQTINTLTEGTVDFLDGAPGQYYFPFSASNLSPQKTRRKQTMMLFLMFFLATALSIGVVYLYDPTLILRLIRS